ncbi:CRAL-TRIO lipid binding domain [Sesbania bispinosa]|nr:CRAL-TRIO lipid binding domain [Sesbania bispinosa]
MLAYELENVVYMHGFDKEGHPEKREKFLRWRFQFLEKRIRKLDFNPGGICTIVQVNDLKNSPGPGKWELRQATKQALQLLQDNYPEFVANQVLL